MTIAKKTANSRTTVKAFRTWIGIAVALVATVAIITVVRAAPGGATLVSTDGITTLATTGTVTPGPYTSGQAITITGTANSVLSNANLVANSVPGQATGNPTGAFYFEECADPGGTVANLPTTSSGCEAATVDFTSVEKDEDGSFDNPSFTVYDLPDLATLGNATMVGPATWRRTRASSASSLRTRGRAASAIPISSRPPSTSRSETGKTWETTLATGPPRPRRHQRPRPCRPRSRAADRAGRASACRRARP
jgi:hypothetical protein